MRPLIDPPVDEGRPWPLVPATADAPHVVATHPDWMWWRDGDGLHARSGDRRVQADNHRALLKRIIKAERGKDG